MVCLFETRRPRASASVQLTLIPSTRPLANRDMFCVQDYVRMRSGTDEDALYPWFFTYNHDHDPLYIAERPGFVRMKMKYQGMVGVLGDAGKTRLTWLVNMDFGGIIPSSFANGLLVSLMAHPRLEEEKVKEYLQREKGDAAAFTSPPAVENVSQELAPISREAFEEMRRKLERAELQIKEKDTQIKERDELITELRKRCSRGKEDEAGVEWDES